jgi:hypothetical protein
MYPSNAHPERPWWRVHVRGRGDVGLPSVLSWRRVWDDQGPIAERDIAEIDTHSPVDRPPPMVGQVWVFDDQTEEIVYTQKLTTSTTVLFAGDKAVTLSWPPSGGVLVAGPTPWGRDVPWAPAGWRP